MFNFLDKVCIFGILGIGRGLTTSSVFTPSEIRDLVNQTESMPREEFRELSRKYSDITAHIHDEKIEPGIYGLESISSNSIGIQVLDNSLEQLRVMPAIDRHIGADINHLYSGWDNWGLLRGHNPFTVNNRKELVKELASELQDNKL